MTAVPIPEDEAERLAVLRSLKVLDTPPEERFDRLTRLAKLSLEVPIAIVGLIDADRQWYKSCIGVPVSQVDRSVTFCSHAIMRPDLMVVEDATLDPRFADHPMVVGEPHIRFYAGVPLLARNQPVGTLCVVDYQPRQLDPAEQEILRTLGRQAEQELETHELTRLTTALAESEATVRGILESVMDAVITFGADLLIQTANPAAEKTFGRSLVGVRLSDLTVGSVDSWQARLRGGPIDCEQVIGRRDDGTEFAVELSMAEVRRAGSGLFLAVARDVSARRELEQAKEAFVSTVSHELRTPLTSIRGALELLSEEEELGSSDRSRLVDIALRSSDRLARLVEEILSLERLRTGRLGVDIRPTPMVGVLESSSAAVYALAQRQDVIVEVGPTDVVVSGDEDRLVQVFTNLIGNAVKFSPAGGRVEVSVRIDEGAARIDVTDNGRGIPSADLERIFEPFEQVERADAKVKGGTGLGLAICRQIVDQLGGTIWVKSVYGEGSTFSVRLPLAD